MKTKKLLVAFNPDKPTAKSSDILLPIFVDGAYRFLGLSSGTLFDYGMVVMIGKSVTVNDVFARLVDSGRKIEDVDQMLEDIANFFALFKEFKISNVLQLEQSSSGSGYRLMKTEFKSSAKKKGLPS